MTKRNHIVLGAMLMAVLATPLWAGDRPEGPGGPGGKKDPPPAAFEACEGKTENAQVTISGPRGESFQAVCRKFHDGRLVAVPEHEPGRGPKPKND